MRSLLLSSLPLLGAAALLGAPACGGGGPGVPLRPLPELVIPPAPAAPLTPSTLLLAPQEKLLWDVHWKGLTIGRIELAVDGDVVNSRFQTGSVVSTVARVRHELSTALDRAGARPASQLETLSVNGEERTVAAIFDGAGYRIEGRPHQIIKRGRAHTLHSALGALRSWAQPGARPGFLILLLAGEALRLEVAEPIAEDLQDRPALRVDARVVGGATPATATLWFRATEDRAPLRIEIATDEARVTAELLEE